MDKETTLDQAMARLKDGMTIAIGGFAGVGSPARCIQRIAESHVKDLTLICVANCHPFAAGKGDIAPLFANRQVRKFITSHNGTNPQAMELTEGDLRAITEAEFTPAPDVRAYQLA